MTDAPRGATGPVSSRRGFGVVGVSLVVAGLLVNGFLAVVARYVPPSQYTYFSAFWSLSLLVGFGAFLPVEQLLARTLPTTPDPGRALRGMVLPAGALLAAELVVVGALSPLLWAATGHDAAVLAALATLCLVSAGQFLLRGWLVGTGRMGSYAAVLVVDCVLRVGLALLVGVLGARGNGGFAWVLVAAIAVAHLPLLARVLARSRPTTTPTDSGPGARARLVPVFALLGGSLAGQVMLNGIPVVVAAVATAAEQVPAGRFQAAFQLVRIPLFLATPLQATILPPLVAAIGRGGHAAVGILVRRLGLGLAVLAAVGAAIGLLLGPQLVRLVFGARYVAARTDVAVLAVGVACYLVALVVTQLLVALDRAAQVTLAWTASVLAAAVVFVLLDLVTDSLFLAAETAFVVGSATAVAVGLVAAARRPSAA